VRGVSRKVYNPYLILSAEDHKLNINVRAIAIKYKESPLVSIRLSIRDKYPLQPLRSNQV
jgi:hypothetical protein